MKRFYKTAQAVSRNGGWEVHLDGRAVRTPGRVVVRLPTEVLACAVADEWAAQDGEVKPRSMPFLRLACTALDRVTPQRHAVIAEIAAFGASDLLCYRAAEPADLVQRQQAAWQPLLDWAAQYFNAPLRVTEGIVPIAQEARALGALRAAVMAQADFPLAGLHGLVSASGSLVIGLAVIEGRLSAAAAWEASQIDEAFQAERWGEDADGVEQRAGLRADMEHAAGFIALCLAKPKTG